MKSILAAILCLSMSGCLSGRIIGATKRHDFATINLEREKAGLKPLTWQEYESPGTAH